MERPKSKLKMLPIESIRASDSALRAVDTQKPEYAELVGSIRDRGILNPPSVREIKDPDTGQMLYGLIDGLHRYTAARDAGLTEIPAHVINMSDADVMEAQIIGNVQKIETKRFEYANQLVKIMNQNPLMTRADMAAKLSKSEAWVSNTLKLTDLPDHVGKLVDNEKISLANAYVLVDLQRLAPDEVDNFLDRAQTLPPTEFGPKVNQRVKEIRQARKRGQDAGKEDFAPSPYPQKSSVIKAEYEKPVLQGKLIEMMECKTPEDGFRAAVMWFMHMDPISIEEGRKKFEEQKEKQRLDKERRAAERAAKREAEAAKSTEEALAEAS